MAINLQSPGIKITEADQITSVGSVGTTTGASVGAFSWGPIDQPTLVTSETDLVSKFGVPSITNNVDFLSASSYLAYSASQYVVRVAGDNALNADSAGSGTLVKNDDAYLDASLTSSGHWVAKHAGVLGNSLKVVICESAAGFDDSSFSEFKGFFDVAPGTSDFVTALGGSNDELHVAVIDEDGKITGVPGTLLEKFESVSKASDARKIDGGTNYYKNVINNTSQYIRWANHVATVVEKTATPTSVDGATTPADATYTTATPHTFVVGETVVVAGADTAGYNGTFVITAADSTTFTVVNAEDSVTGTFTAGTATVAAQSSNWGNTAAGTTFADGGIALVHIDSLGGGAEGDGVGDAERISGMELFANKLNLDVDVLICGQGGSTVVDKAIEIAEARKDCVAVFSPQRADVVNSAGTEATKIAAFALSVSARSTYAVADSNWKYAFDRYNDVYTYVPCNADVAGCIARTDANGEPWFSPAGYQNGRILNSVRLAWNPTETERDSLYKLGINPIFSQPGRGTVLFGDKTFTQKKTSFSRINVRRLFITIQSAIGDAAGDVLFGQNDAAQRASFSNVVGSYLRTVQGGRGVTDFRVICDGTNNPDSVVNANEFVCDIFVRPIASVNFIQLNFTSVAGAAAFAEIGG